MKLRKEAIDIVVEICDRYKNEPSPLMLILSDVQKEYGYIPLEVQEIISAKTGIPVSDIYGVVTFYNFFSLEPKGKYVIGVCIGTACYVKGGQNILDKFGEALKIKPGQTTEDGLFIAYVVSDYRNCAFGETPDEALDNLREKATYYTASFADADAM